MLLGGNPLKRFFNETETEATAPVWAGRGASYVQAVERSAVHGEAGGALPAPVGPARIAVYDDLTSSPRVIDVDTPDHASFIDELSTRTYELVRQQGGRLPYSVIREVAENLIHARFREVVVSILDEGATVRFSDAGPGIKDKARAFEPGYSTADEEMKRIIRGVGSGLPIARESLSFSGGHVSVDDNLGCGTVVTLRLDPGTSGAQDGAPAPDRPRPGRTSAPPDADLTTRQKQVLSLALELGDLGPSVVSTELGVAVSTAYRDLARLEEMGLVVSGGGGKRRLSEQALSMIDGLLHG